MKAIGHLQHERKVLGRVVVAALALSVTAAILPAHAACAPPGLTPIHALFDSDAKRVRLRGVVTARFPGLHGYFLEAPRRGWDDDPQTSEGVFVYTGHQKSVVKPGTTLVVAARPSVFHGLPELTHARILAHCGRHPLPPATSLNAPISRQRWGELLGMRVRFTRSLTVTDLDDFGRYGEVRVAFGERPFAPTALTAPGPAALVLRRESGSRSLWLDDGSSRSHLTSVELAGHRFDAAHPLRAGQRLKELEGIAYHAFKRDLLEPTHFELERKTNPRRLPGKLGLPPGLRVVSSNVENYFDRALHGSRFPTERGARNRAALKCQTGKLVAALGALHPAVVALQEVENDGVGYHGALASLVAALNGALPGSDYRYVHPHTPRLGDGLIAPALVYDAKRLTPVGKVAELDPASLPRTAARGLARPALAASFRIRQGGFVFTVAVVHLRSKLTACGDALDSKGGAGYCALARTAATRNLARWLATMPTGAGGKRVVLLGDFNAYPKEHAITQLIAAGWHDLVARHVPFNKRYTEIYKGRIGELDYAFASELMSRHVAGAAIWHSDADEARALGYVGAMAPCSSEATPWRASDHDPVIVVLKP